MAGSEYSFSSRLLHRLALQSKMMAEISFDVDNSIASKKGITFSDEPVFISGLARSGTTMLMRYLHESGRFRSLTYMDMPFVLMPNLWKKLSSGRSSGSPKERAHQDGIMVSFDSPEAFEEVFWRVFTGSDYIREDRLELQKVQPDILGKFRDYIRNVIISAEDPRQQRYLSKNNNNILRLPYLFKSFAKARVVIPFRDPLQHALSLLNQHRHFSGIQASDHFSLEYMNWLGHYEFGLNQKPFCFGKNETFIQMEKADRMSLDFWLLSWKNYYDFALGQDAGDIIFFCYEEFCRQPGATLDKLFKELDISDPPPSPEAFSPQVKAIGGYDQSLLQECGQIYESLLAKFNLWYHRNGN